MGKSIEGEKIMKIIINKLKKEEIFTESFLELNENNVIDFPNSGIAIIYGPNGAGKTSFANILGNESNTEFSIEFNDRSITNENSENIFHNISDQNTRNIIQGNTEDFILGDNIKLEYKLKNEIDSSFSNLFGNSLKTILNKDFEISAKNSPLITIISNKLLKGFVESIVNVRDKGRGIDRTNFISTIDSLKTMKPIDFDEIKYKYIIGEYKNKKSIISQINKLVETDFQKNESVRRIEENKDAVYILEKYDYLNDCLVCDNDIERKKLLEEKINSKEETFRSLDDKTKKILEEIVNKITANDPLKIKDVILDTIISGDFARILVLKTEIDKAFEIFNIDLNNQFKECLNEINLKSDFNDYEELIKDKPILENEDILFVQGLINDYLDKKIELIRDFNGNLNLVLANKDFLGIDRKELLLSNGEQNFISLSFELLKAKKLETPIIVLDDPISSFDSIYKNKIAYSILKFLENKKQIILTHNIDLIRLLTHQRPNSFNLFLLNNTLGEKNGFIKVSQDEIKLLLYTHEIINFFRDAVFREILEEKTFLISTIPFMRGFSMLINNIEIKNKLTNLMHGYKTEIEDIADLYNKLFEPKIPLTSIKISAQDILNIDLNNLDIVNKEKYPLLNKSLVHTINYLFIRLKVEKVLVDKFTVVIEDYDTLYKIIKKAFANGTDSNIKSRNFLLSRKTLLNEFNHCEFDLNIFQPAIDITNSALNKEKTEILEFLDEISQ